MVAQRPAEAVHHLSGGIGTNPQDRWTVRIRLTCAAPPPCPRAGGPCGGGAPRGAPRPPLPAMPGGGLGRPRRQPSLRPPPGGAPQGVVRTRAQEERRPPPPVPLRPAAR